MKRPSSVNYGYIGFMMLIIECALGIAYCIW